MHHCPVAQTFLSAIVTCRTRMSGLLFTQLRGWRRSPPLSPKLSRRLRVGFGLFLAAEDSQCAKG